MSALSVLLTGCAGFIGWKVAEMLLEQGHTVAGVDNLNDAYDVRLKHWRLAQLEGLLGVAAAGEEKAEQCIRSKASPAIGVELSCPHRRRR